MGEKTNNGYDGSLIWIDLEMTGLDPSREHIIEIATIVTDANLNETAVGPNLVIHQPDDVLERMDAWNRKQHSKSGLCTKVQDSKITYAEAEAETLEFLRRLVPAGKSPMCGNTVSQDRRFLRREMPMLEAYFHYRHIDVSTLKELMQRWAPELAKKFVSRDTHRALDDVRESIDELRFYRDNFVVKNSKTD